MKQLFPKEIIEDTSQVHQFEHSSKSKMIYTSILLAVIISLILLPFIKVDIYTTTRGILKPSKERVLITPLQSGKVTFVNMVDNQSIKKGDTLVMTNATVINKKKKQLMNQLKENNQFIADCKYLINSRSPRVKSIQSVRYQKEYLYVTEKLNELRTIFEKARVDHLRNKKLFEKGVIAKVDQEQSAYDYHLALNNLRQYKQQQKNNWQTIINEYYNKIREIEGMITDLEQNQEELIITAPIDGILKKVKGIEVGSLLIGGTPIAEISPNANLIAECYLSPSDIGLVNENKPVNFQIDAFNYNQWGLATGKILDISKDIDVINQQPMFKIRCIVDQHHLQLKNGFEGHFNKGMTLSARFQITQRTLYELLYDNVDDWLNPSSPTIAKSKDIERY